MTFQSIKDIPPIGFGLWKIAPEQCAEVVYEAVKSGYRRFDSACDYGNEKQVGEGLQRAMTEGLCSRQDLWVTSNFGTPTVIQIMFPPAMNKACQTCNWIILICT
jgi:D-xylose reductase